MIRLGTRDAFPFRFCRLFLKVRVVLEWGAGFLARVEGRTLVRVRISMTQPLPRVSGIILAGGQSRRMGHDKAFIEFDGKPIIQRVVERTQQVCAETIIVANEADVFARILGTVAEGARVVSDVFPGKASLGGLFSGLQAAREPFALAVACDMPFLNVELLRYLVTLAPQSDVVIPRASDHSGKTPRGARREKNADGRTAPRTDQPLAKEADLHPLHAVYSKNCLAPMLARLQADDLRMIGFHDAVRVRVVSVDEVNRYDPQHWSFFNMNTPTDLQVAWSHGQVIG